MIAVLALFDLGVNWLTGTTTPLGPRAKRPGVVLADSWLSELIHLLLKRVTRRNGEETKKGGIPGCHVSSCQA